MKIYAEIDVETKMVTNILAADDWILESRQDVILGSFPVGSNKKTAAIGDVYIPEEDIFIYPKPYPSWKLSANKLNWEAPVPVPEDFGSYIWNEETQSWQLDNTIP